METFIGARITQSATALPAHRYVGADVGKVEGDAQGRAPAAG